MKLTISCPLSLTLVVFHIALVISNAYRVEDAQRDGWIPISRQRLSRYVIIDNFTPLVSPEVDSEKKIQKNNQIEVITNLPPPVQELYDNVDSKVILEEKVERILEKIKKLYDKSRRIKAAKGASIAESAPTSQLSVISSTPHAIASATLRPEVGYDIPLISYSDHATNKSDATAYYPRPNDYYGARVRRLRINSELNENIDPTPNDAEKFKSNNLNSGKGTFSDATEIEKGGDAELEFETPSSRSNVNDDNEDFPEKYIKNVNNLNNGDISKISNHTSKETQHTNKASGVLIDLRVSNNESNYYNGSFNIDAINPGNKNDVNGENSEQEIVYKKPGQEFHYTLNQILERNRFNNNDILLNYAISRSRINTNSVNKITASLGYNSLNHLPIDPVLAVILSNYGYYLPGYNGRYVGYRNLYGYLASNNIHNNKPFGSYKLFSDTRYS